MERLKKSSYEYPDRVDDLGGFEKTMTQQHFVGEVDINNIVARALKTGILGDPMAIAGRQAVFGDFSAVGSYHEALNRITAAQAAFMELPADVRSRFNNDPGALVDYMSSPFGEDKLREAVGLGLVPQKALDDFVAAVTAAKVTPAPTPGPVPPDPGNPAPPA